MIVHIGWETSVDERDILAILNKKSALVSKETAAFIENAKREKRFVPCEYEEESYLLIQAKDSPSVVVSSAIHSATLKKRMGAAGLAALAALAHEEILPERE